jgi:hypothetical protein
MQNNHDMGPEFADSTNPGALAHTERDFPARQGGPIRLMLAGLQTAQLTIRKSRYLYTQVEQAAVAAAARRQ